MQTIKIYEYKVTPTIKFIAWIYGVYVVFMFYHIRHNEYLSISSADWSEGGGGCGKGWGQRDLSSLMFVSVALWQRKYLQSSSDMRAQRSDLTTSPEMATVSFHGRSGTPSLIRFLISITDNTRRYHSNRQTIFIITSLVIDGANFNTDALGILI